MTNTIKSDPPNLYQTEIDENTITRAIEIIQKRFADGEAITRPTDAGKYLQVLLAGSEHEVFGVLMLNNRNEIIAWREMFRGTIDGASVYPREVVKQTLADNAAAVILCHNHPSGTTDPSVADQRITKALQSALNMLQIRVPDHLIVGKDVTSLAEKGLM